MNRTLTLVMVTTSLLAALVLLSSCSKSEEDVVKGAVISVFGAMEKNDEAALLYHLDVPELMKHLNEDYALNSDSPRVFTNPEQLLADLTGEGKTKRVWFSHQRIISSVKIIDDATAAVDVTFVNKEASKGYMARFGLSRSQIDGVWQNWKVYSFQTLSRP